jgi:hypothetical protein
VNSTSETRRCPRCAETIQAAAQVCRFCGAEFDGSGAVRPAAVPLKEPGGGGCTIAMFVLLGLGAVAFLIFQYGGSRARETAEQIRPVSETVLACEGAGDQIPALNEEIKRRLPKPGTFRVSRTESVPDSSYSRLDALVMFTAENPSGKRLEGMATAKITGRACSVSSFEWVCLQPGVAPADGQLFCGSDGKPEPT